MSRRDGSVSEAACLALFPPYTTPGNPTALLARSLCSFYCSKVVGFLLRQRCCPIELLKDSLGPGVFLQHLPAQVLRSIQIHLHVIPEGESTKRVERRTPTPSTRNPNPELKLLDRTEGEPVEPSHSFRPWLRGLWASTSWACATEACGWRCRRAPFASAGKGSTSNSWNSWVYWDGPTGNVWGKSKVRRMGLQQQGTPMHHHVHP